MKVLIYLLIGLVFSEILLRLFWNPPFLKYKRDDFEWVSKNVTLNRFGYRDKEFEINKPKNTFRVYSLGDSYTYGWYIDNFLDAYPKILENELKKKSNNLNVEVINASRAGFSLKDSIDRFKNEGYLFSPDLVTIGINIQDIASKEFAPKFTKNKFIKNLDLYQATFGVIERKRVGKLTYNEVVESYKDDSKQLENAKNLLTELKKEIDKLDAKLIVIVFPQYNPNEPNSEYKYSFYHTGIKKLLESLSIKSLDLYESYNSVKDKKELVINPTDPHPTVLANRIAGEELSKMISINSVSLGLISKELIPPDVVFDRKFGLNTQKLFLPNTINRNLGFLEDKLLTAKAQTHGGWPGAKLEYNISGNSSKLIISRKLYGFDVLGISKIQVFWREEGAQQSLDISPESVFIRRTEDEISIDTGRLGRDDYYKITLDLAVYQKDYEDNRVVSSFKSEIINKSMLSNTWSYANYGWLNDKQVILNDNFEIQIPAAVKQE